MWEFPNSRLTLKGRIDVDLQGGHLILYTVVDYPPIATVTLKSGRKVQLMIESGERYALGTQVASVELAF